MLELAWAAGLSHVAAAAAAATAATAAAAGTRRGRIWRAAYDAAYKVFRARYDELLEEKFGDTKRGMVDQALELLDRLIDPEMAA